MILMSSSGHRGIQSHNTGTYKGTKEFEGKKYFVEFTHSGSRGWLVGDILGINATGYMRKLVDISKVKTKKGEVVDWVSRHSFVKYTPLNLSFKDEVALRTKMNNPIHIEYLAKQLKGNPGLTIDDKELLKEVQASPFFRS